MSDYQRALRLYRGIHLKAAHKKVRRRVQWPTVLVDMGHVTAIEYVCIEGGRAQPYRHKFSPGSRPILAAGIKRGELFLLSGRFHVTGRLIVDLDSAGREIDDGGKRR